MPDSITALGLILILAGLAHSIHVGGLRRCSDYHLMPDRSAARAEGRTQDAN